MAIRAQLPRAVAALATALATAASIPLTATSAAAAVSPLCMSGTLQTKYQSAESGTSKPWETKPVRNATVQLWGTVNASDTPYQLTSQQYTDQNNGNFNICYTPASTTPVNSMWVQFTTEHGNVWKVSDTNHNPYTLTSSTLYNVNYSYNFGTISPVSSDTDSTNLSRAWHAFDTVNPLWWNRDNTSGSNCWSSHEADSNHCTELNIQWTPTSNDGPYYDLNNTVHLSAEDPDSEHTVLHESGHFFMHRLFNGWFPTVTNCSPHSVPKASSDTCAWTEGFADATAAYIEGDYRYVWSSGSSQDFTYNAAAGWDSGDQVQGNVDGALLDLWRDQNLDQNWDQTLSALTANDVSNFSQYFRTARPAVGLSTGTAALNHLSDHTINYNSDTVSLSGHFVGAGSGLCLTAPSTTWSTQNTIQSCSGAGNQTWTLIPASSTSQQGQLQLGVTDSAGNNLCLDDYGSTGQGSPVTIYPCGSTNTHQQWTLYPDGTIRSADPAVAGLCLDVTYGATSPGSPVELYTCNGGTDQKWSR
ncbi:RICIN domain-containing protein [Kitasatospora kifunensis]|uniref:Ricin B lectin domain-containing protein n=1 Tax=Kitasatospora kifunensis TaxID=58351 RepID=A0A7W7VYV7_KITKI|nr:RICIN domain-containing protein [Kitasatospora kifunensis]MBB4928137.1 hypothetical protein [Kitasatospora kifunensis]